MKTSTKVNLWMFTPILIGFLVIVYWTERRDQEREIRETVREARLLAELNALEENPCATRLEFVRLIRWQITCSGCSTMRASRLFSPDVLQAVEMLSINGHVPLIHVFRRDGECP